MLFLVFRGQKTFYKINTTSLYNVLFTCTHWKFKTNIHVLTVAVIGLRGPPGPPQGPPGMHARKPRILADVRSADRRARAGEAQSHRQNQMN